jgi:hypothetical protein
MGRNLPHKTFGFTLFDIVDVDSQNAQKGHNKRESTERHGEKEEQKGHGIRHYAPKGTKNKRR